MPAVLSFTTDLIVEKMVVWGLFRPSLSSLCTGSSSSLCTGSSNVVGSTDPPRVYDFTRCCKCKRSVGLFAFAVRLGWFSPERSSYNARSERHCVCVRLELGVASIAVVLVCIEDWQRNEGMRWVESIIGPTRCVKFLWVLKFVSNVKITTFFCFDVLHGTMKQSKQGFIILWMLSIRNMHLFSGETGISDGHKLLRHDPHKSMLPYHETI